MEQLFNSSNKEMSERWVSNAKHWCSECKVWLSGDASSIRKHEGGGRHRRNVTINLRELRKRKREDEFLDREIRDIEKAAEISMGIRRTSKGNRKKTKDAEMRTGESIPPETFPLDHETFPGGVQPQVEVQRDENTGLGVWQRSVREIQVPSSDEEDNQSEMKSMQNDLDQDKNSAGQDYSGRIYNVSESILSEYEEAMAAPAFRSRNDPTLDTKKEEPKEEEFSGAVKFSFKKRKNSSGIRKPL